MTENFAKHENEAKLSREVWPTMTISNFSVGYSNLSIFNFFCWKNFSATHTPFAKISQTFLYSPFLKRVYSSKAEDKRRLRMVKHRNIFLVYLFSIITFGIYALYWMVSTKNEMNSLGAKIPTAWLIIVPIANIYWMYKYCEGFAENVKKDNNTVLWFILYILVGIVMPAIVQSELNKLARA